MDGSGNECSGSDNYYGDDSYNDGDNDDDKYLDDDDSFCRLGKIDSSMQQTLPILGISFLYLSKSSY